MVSVGSDDDKALSDHVHHAMLKIDPAAPNVRAQVLQWFRFSDSGKGIRSYGSRQIETFLIKGPIMVPEPSKVLFGRWGDFNFP